jgi:probable HAF family extracellular repeat protein
LCAVGYQDAGFFTPFHALRWTEATKAVDLGTLNPQSNSTFSSFATDTSQDCSVVVGISNQTSTFVEHAFRWTQSGGMVDLGVPANGGPNSRAFGVSSNGTVIVGDADFPAGSFIRKGAFRWTGGSFTDLIPGLNSSLATAVSADGTVVVGQVRSSNGTNALTNAFRWTAPTPPAQPVLQPIGPLPGHRAAAATAVSDNGKIVVGISHQDFLQFQGPVLGWNPGTAFRWTQAKGIQDLRQVLVDSGVDMTGITLISVTGMSPDGQWIQGAAATTPQTGPGETVAYIAQVCDDDIGGPCTTNGVAPFQLDAAPKQLSVAAGQSGSTTITVTPDAGFTQPVSFSCGGLPVGASCSFIPATVTPAGGPINTMLTISTNGGAVALLSPDTSPMMFAFLLSPFVLLPVGMILRRRGSDRRLFSVAVGFVATLTLAGMLSCGGSDSSLPPVTNSGGSPPANGTPAGTSNVTVTATSGSSSSSVPVQITVTR